MHRITMRNAENMAQAHINNPELEYVIYNIRERRFSVHDYYLFLYRFSRREAVWSQPIGHISDLSTDFENVNILATDLYNNINEIVENTLSRKHRREFTRDDCFNMLRYYFNGKTYLAYYDNYLGRVVLIKERDKTNDFGDLIGERYYFIGNLHEIITQELDIPQLDLKRIMKDIMVYQPIEEIEGMCDLNERLHGYLVEEIKRVNRNIDLINKYKE